MGGGKRETLHVRVERSVGVNGEIKIAESAQVGPMVEQQGSERSRRRNSSNLKINRNYEGINSGHEDGVALIEVPPT